MHKLGTNRKEVKAIIRTHILDHFTDGWDNPDPVANLKLQTQHTSPEELVAGGTFLIYYEDVQDFLNGLGINPEMKSYTNDQSWNLYKYLIAREIEYLINKES